MPNFMPWSSAGCSRAGAEQLLERSTTLAPLHLVELREPLPSLLDCDGDERAVLALLRPVELVLDVAQVKLLLRHHALEGLAVLGAIEHAEVRLELGGGQPFDGVDSGERDDAPDVGRELLQELAIAPEVLRAVREVRLDLRGHGFRLDAETVDPVREDLGVSLLVAIMDLHRAVQVALGLHLPQQPLEADHAGVLADAVLLEDQGVRLRVADDFAEAGEVDVDRVVGARSGFSHRFLLPSFGGPRASSTPPRPRG